MPKFVSEATLPTTIPQQQKQLPLQQQGQKLKQGASGKLQTQVPGQQQLLGQNPAKKVKKEPTDQPTPARNHQLPTGDQPEAKRQKAGKTRGRAGATGETIAWALGEIRSHLETIPDVEGVKELLDRFPECVLLGGIAARRELVASLLGDHGVATNAAALLVAPGMRQPIALELRCGSEDFGSFNGPEAEAWLRSVQQAAAQALGHRLKVDALRLRLSAMGCANLDVVDLPDKTGSPGSAVPPKIEEMRLRHLGSPSNLLVCLEPGEPLDLCRRFDPPLSRTLRLGAAATDGGNAVALCGPEAARCLEERFAALCHDRVPQWMQALEKLEARLTRGQAEAREIEQRESSDEVLRRARAAGTSFGRALEHVINGATGCAAGAMTLEDELADFAQAAAKGNCGFGTILSAKDAAAAAADVFAQFDGVEGYAAYLRDTVHVAAADVPLNGGAAWQRLLQEVEVAMRLSSPPPDELSKLMLNAIKCGGTGVHGHQRWEDLWPKLMFALAFEPLRRRIRYVTARVVFVLKVQKNTVSEWMATLSGGPAARCYSPLFPEHLRILRTVPLVRDLVFAAYDEAVTIVGEQVLKSLEDTLMAACINPEIMLRASTKPDLDPRKPLLSQTSVPVGKTERSEARQRVANELSLRSGPSAGLPVQLSDRVFDPRVAELMMPFVEEKLETAFRRLASTLATHAFALADTSLSELTRRQMDEAMSKIDYSADQKRALAARHAELEDMAQHIEERLQAVRHCVTVLKNFRK